MFWIVWWLRNTSWQSHLPWSDVKAMWAPVSSCFFWRWPKNHKTNFTTSVSRQVFSLLWVAITAPIAAETLTRRSKKIGRERNDHGNDKVHQKTLALVMLLLEKIIKNNRTAHATLPYNPDSAKNKAKWSSCNPWECQPSESTVLYINVNRTDVGGKENTKIC